jgi:coatomer subunit epsilon
LHGTFHENPIQSLIIFRPSISKFARSALQALSLLAQYEQCNSEEAQTSIVEKMKSVVASDGSPSTQLFAAQLFCSHGLVKDALQQVHLGVTMEHMSLKLQLFLKLDRLDLAVEQYHLLRQADEDAVLTAIGGVHVALATGASASDTAIHTLSMLSEQYGPSVLLMNLMAASYIVSSKMEAAEGVLTDCRRDFPTLNADTLINLIVCTQHQGKDVGPLIAELQQAFPTHPFSMGLERVIGAFERESIKYKVAA